MIELDLFDAHPIIGESEEKIELDVVLSVFDGMSCGQLALKQAGMSPRVYYASEIEKSPMDITKKNFPSTIMLGDVRKVKGEDLPHVNLLLGGSPCQGFSFAGKQLNFDHPQSKLFFEFVRLLNECKPDFFLLENVVMQQSFMDAISIHVSGKLEPGEKGIQPQMINSADCSAQSRKRLYWWGKRVGDKYIQLPIPAIKDKGIVLRDILETNPDSKHNLSESMVNRVLKEKRGKGYFYDEDSEKIGTVIAGYYKYPTDGSYVKRPPSQPNEILYEEPYVKLNGNRAGCVGYVGNSPKQSTRIYSVDGKSQCLSANGGGQGGKTGLYQVPICGRIVGRKINPETGKRDDHNPDLKMEQRIEPRLDEKSGTLTTVQKDNVLIQESLVFLNENQQRKIDKINPTLDKANCLTTAIGRGGSSSEYLTAVKKKTLLLDEQGEGPTYRKLTVKECSRLQTLPDSYLEDCFDEKGKKISNSQKYRALGNGWTVDVIVHILQGMKYIVKD